MGTTGPGLLRATVTVWCLCSGGLACGSPAEEFAACTTGMAAAPHEYEAALCFFSTASRTGAWERAAERLSAMEASYPDSGWPRLVRAHVYLNVGDPRAEDLYRRTAEDFRAAGNLHGELVARSNLRALLFRSGRVQEASREIERIADIGAQTTDSELKIRAVVDQSRHDVDTGANLSRAHTALLQASAKLDAAHPYWLRQEVLTNLGRLELRFGRYQQAVSRFQQVEAQAEAHDDLVSLALARFNAANATYEMLVESPRPEGRAQVAALADAALAAAEDAQRPSLVAGAHRLLAELYLVDDPERARHHLALCSSLAAELEEPGVQSECMWGQARILAASDEAAAERLIARAVSLMAANEDTARLGHAWRHHMRISWETRPVDEALVEAERALDVFESLRSLQADEHGRTGLLAAWARDYYWLSGQLLRSDETREDPELLARAFAVTERMRARALLEALETAADPGTPDPRLAAAHQRTLENLVAHQRRLFVTADVDARAHLLNEIAELELAELEARRALARSRGRPTVEVPTVELAEVQAMLAPDEALLSFQISPWEDISNAFAGGAWLVVATARSARAFRLPGRTDLADSVSVARGLMGSPGATVNAEVQLYRRVFGNALDHLPETVNRLVVVLDHPLHQFPMTALRPGPDAAPIGERHELTFVPSATLWHRWRSRPAASHERTALVLANPQIIDAAEASASMWRDWTLDGGMELGPLPYAEAEGHTVRRRLGADTQLLTGATASEAALKAAPLASFDILHFATHAVVDVTHPERSAVLLAPGDDGQDGLLQVREIADLNLDGQVVVLSSCYSAGGTHVRGEGVQGLARAFFAAGASTVIGSLWPMRDDHAAAFVDAFYAAVAEGLTISAAFRRTQRELRAGGLPPDAWAGFQVMGNGAVTVTPHPAPHRPGWRWLAGLAALGALGTAAWLTRRFTRSVRLATVGQSGSGVR